MVTEKKNSRAIAFELQKLVGLKMHRSSWLEKQLQVGGPVEEVEEGEGEGEAYPGDDVDPLGAGGEPAEPPFAAQEVSTPLFVLRHVDLAVSEFGGHRVQITRHQGLLGGI
ncbi:hypothetical protein AVEN_115698-1 [Araneus ventricosus]|uniref:Uncharacterized protein n=1 Tax=Araneus ventricosus TaxID=182803 RepID=A0A4Y2X0W7_ARAVE|nr:hypothetical protein AVEN_115698-1 [Araneus ventricosus]